ncbi:uncharacterized protein [Eurosta solidaginis]|uniref:uncharacterized protein n=1 Tax=Eurosta solidaginis TaxID=178769 RepID=UPI0035309BC2
MTLILAKIVGCALLLILHCATNAEALHLSHDNQIEGIQSGLYNAGPLGNYAGLLSAAEAVSQLQSPKSYDVEEHDFGSNDGDSSDVETLGAAGDHLEEKHFPTDVGEAAAHVRSAESYEESESAATQQHEDIAESGYEGYEHLQKAGIHGGYQDFHNHPIVGIDHGKGALSYSTLYEHKHDEQKGYEN